MDEIATEASNLAMIWQEVAQQIIRHDSASIDNDENWKNLILSPPQLINGISFSRLESFFRITSSVLGRHNNKEMEPIIFHLGSILKERHLTREYVEKALSQIKQNTFLYSEPKTQDFKSIEQSVLILHKEAGALNAYAKAFRAKI